MYCWPRSCWVSMLTSIKKLLQTLWIQWLYIILIVASIFCHGTGLQKHYGILEALALGEDEMPDIKDETLPDEEGLARYMFLSVYLCMLCPNSPICFLQMQILDYSQPSWCCCFIQTELWWWKHNVLHAQISLRYSCCLYNKAHNLLHA